MDTDVLDIMDESGMTMDSSDEEEDAAPIAAAPVESIPTPIKESSPIGKCVPVTEVAPVAPKAEVISAAPPVKLICGNERGMDTDVLDIMDESGMTMDSDEDDIDASEETTSSGDISDMSTESLKEVEEVPKVPAPDVKNPAAEAV